MKVPSLKLNFRKKGKVIKEKYEVYKVFRSVTNILLCIFKKKKFSCMSVKILQTISPLKKTGMVLGRFYSKLKSLHDFFFCLQPPLSLQIQVIEICISLLKYNFEINFIFVVYCVILNIDKIYF